MTVLPIVARELRTAARRAGTYWNRLIVALVAVALCMSIFVVDLGASTQEVGQFIFRGLAGLLLLYCLFQGRRASADCLSEEKREGTLGLLFLTDLKGHDVVLGKLAATSLGGFYGLMTVFPVLALTLLLGGVSSAEFWRMVLVLLNTFLFSLAVGVMSSALSRDHRRAMAANFFLLLMLAAAPPACGSVIAARAQSPATPFPHPFFYSCPIYTFGLSFDLTYKGNAANFWRSLGLIHALSWLLVGLASWVVPHTWQDRPSRAGRNWWREFWQWVSFGSRPRQTEYRRRLLTVNAFYWLAARARLKAAHVWVFIGCMCLWWVAGWIASRALWLDSGVAVLMALLLNTTLKVWLVTEAGQRLADDQQAGALELILSTPLSVREILTGQWLALRRQFLGPLLAVLAIETTWILHLAPRGHDDDPRPFLLAGMVMLVADMVALGWVAIRAALTAKNHNRATISAFSRILVLPWLGFGLVWALGNAWCTLTSDAPWEPGTKVQLALWLGWGLGADLLFGLLAWRQSHTRFRQYALQRYSPPQPRLARWLRSVRHATAVTTPAKVASPSGPKPWSWRRRAALAAVCLALLAVPLAWWRLTLPPSYPPPMPVSLTASNAPISMSFFWGQTMVIVLPDGSLWRWGRTRPGDPRYPVVPERIGAGSDWVKVATTASANHWLALRRDGTLWEGDRIGPEIGEPLRPLAGSNWVDLASANSLTCTLRRDGTLWSWDRPPKLGASSVRTSSGVPPPPGRVLPRPITNAANATAAAGREGTTRPAPATTNFSARVFTNGISSATAGGSGARTRYGVAHPLEYAPNQPAQLGTNRNWASISGAGASLLGLQTDGTLWAWGEIWPAWNRQGWTTNAPQPVQVCLETNWQAISGVAYGAAWNQAGELWEPFAGPPSPKAPATAVARLLLTNSAPDRVAAAYGVGPELFEIRRDGTLWRRAFPFTPWSAAVSQEWRQVGKRRDWVGIWGGGLVALGLTADGTLWTWGADFTHEARPTFFTRLQIARTRLAAIFGANRRVGVGSFGIPPVYVNEPRPLLKLEEAPRP